MEVYRIEKQRFLPTILDGIPGKKCSFRWNTKGHPMIYSAENRSLALVEKLANIGAHYGGIPPDYFMVVLEIPDNSYRKIEPSSLPLNWDALEEYHIQTQKIGNTFLHSDELILLVPSVIVKGEFNVLLNPSVLNDGRISTRIEQIDARLQWPVNQ